MSAFQSLAGALALVLALSPLAALAQTQHFGSRTPSAQEIVDQLDPPKTRGIVPGAASKATAGAPAPAAPAAAPSISMKVEFAFDSDRIQPQSAGALSNLAKALQDQRLTAKTFNVIGHTDATGAFVYNMTLSQRRAAAVKNYLVNQGIDPSRLKTSGKGPTDLLNKTDPAAGENRRVEIAVSG